MYNFVKQLISLIIAGIVLILISYAGYMAAQPMKYIRGTYGTKCYVEEQAHEGIKKPLYFNSIEECLDSLKTISTQ